MIPKETEDKQFKIYDTVRHEEFGIGTVIGIRGIDTISVDFDEYDPRLHTCLGECEDCQGWHCRASELEKVK